MKILFSLFLIFVVLFSFMSLQSAKAETTYEVDVLFWSKDNLFPAYQLSLTNPDEDCSSMHYHSIYGDFFYHLDGKKQFATRPLGYECQFGISEAYFSKTVSISNDEIIQYLEITGVDLRKDVSLDDTTLEKNDSHPTLKVPENIVQETAATHALVLFSVSASDVEDGKIIPVCSHKNGDKFPRGTTTVTCIALNSAGNSVTKTFTVTIKTWPGAPLGHGSDAGVSAEGGEIAEPADIPEPKSTLPPQQKQVFKWWAEDLVSDEEMMNSITFMFETEIISSDKIEIFENVESSEYQNTLDSQKSTFPPHQKQVLQWWAEGLVSDEEVMNNITYLFETESLHSPKIKIKNEGAAKVTSNNPYDGKPFAKVTPNNPYDDKPLAKITSLDPYDGFPKVTSIDPNSDEWEWTEDETIIRTYESQKWVQAITTQLVSIKNAQINVLENAEKEISSSYAQDSTPETMVELVAIKNAEKQVAAEVLQAVELLKNVNEIISETQNIAVKAGIHVSELADVALEQQEIIDSVIPELDSFSDFENAYDNLDDNITQADLAINNDPATNVDYLYEQYDIQNKFLKVVMMFTFETKEEADNAARSEIERAWTEGMTYKELSFRIGVEEFERAIGQERFLEIFNEIKSQHSKQENNDENASVSNKNDSVIDDLDPYQLPLALTPFDPDTWKDNDDQSQTSVLMLNQYELNDIENDKVKQILETEELEEADLPGIEEIEEDPPGLEEIEEESASENPITADAALYRLVGMYDHFYTTDVNEKNNAHGYTYERIEGYVFSTQELGTTPLYRLFNGVDHFYVIDIAERNNAMTIYGYVDEGIECYVYSTQEPGTVPLYRLFNGQHFYTADLTEKDNAIAHLGYGDEGIECYVFPNNP